MLLGTTAWRAIALSVKLIGQKLCWFAALAGDDGLSVPTIANGQ